MNDLFDGERMSNQQEGTDKQLILSAFFPRRKQQHIMQCHKNKWKQGEE